MKPHVFASLSRKAIALSLCAVFSLENAVWAAPATPDLNVTQNAKLLQSFDLPQSIGKIDKSFIPSGNKNNLDQPVLFIQDAHAQPEAQKNIQKILEKLSDQKLLRGIVVESAEGEIHPETLDIYQEKEKNQKLWSDLANQGELTGVELFALSDKGRKTPLYGAEDVNVYARSYRAYEAVTKFKPAIHKILKEYAIELEQIEMRYLPKDLALLLQSERNFHEASDGLLPHISRLSNLADKYLGLDLNQSHAQFEWPNFVRVLKAQTMQSQLKPEQVHSEIERLRSFINQTKLDLKTKTFFREGLEHLNPSQKQNFQNWITSQERFEKIKSARVFLEKLYETLKTSESQISLLNYPHLLNWLTFNIAQEEVEPKGLFEELENLQNQVTQKLIRNDRDKQIVSLSREYGLIEKMMSFEMTRNQISEWSTRKLDARKFSVKFSTLARRSIPLLPARIFKIAKNFYSLAHERDNILTTALLRKQNDWKKKGFIVLIAGGYHAQGILGQLEAKKIPYLSVMPHLTIHPDLENLYEKVMMGKLASDLRTLEKNDGLGAWLRTNPRSGLPSRVAARLGIGVRQELRAKYALDKSLLERWRYAASEFADRNKKAPYETTRAALRESFKDFAGEKQAQITQLLEAFLISDYLKNRLAGVGQTEAVDEISQYVYHRASDLKALQDNPLQLGWHFILDVIAVILPLRAVSSSEEGSMVQELRREYLSLGLPENQAEALERMIQTHVRLKGFDPNPFWANSKEIQDAYNYLKREVSQIVENKKDVRVADMLYKEEIILRENEVLIDVLNTWKDGDKAFNFFETIENIVVYITVHQKGQSSRQYNIKEGWRENIAELMLPAGSRINIYYRAAYRNESRTTRTENQDLPRTRLLFEGSSPQDVFDDVAYLATLLAPLVGGVWLVSIGQSVMGGLLGVLGFIAFVYHYFYQNRLLERRLADEFWTSSDEIAIRDKEYADLEEIFPLATAFFIEKVEEFAQREDFQIDWRSISEADLDILQSVLSDPTVKLDLLFTKNQSGNGTIGIRKPINPIYSEWMSFDFQIVEAQPALRAESRAISPKQNKLIVPSYYRDGFELDSASLISIAKAFQDELVRGLKGHASSLATLPAFVGKPTGKEKGVHMALDLGGTNFRVLTIDLNGKDTIFKTKKRKYTIPEEVMTGTPEALFNFIAASVADFMNETGMSKTEQQKLGFTFSFAVTQQAIAKGKILSWSKGFDIPEAIGKDPVKLLEAAFKRKGIENIAVKALVNDTVGTLVAAALKDPKVLIGMILGTGMNAAYWELVSNIKKLSPAQRKAAGKIMAINTELGNFNQLNQNQFDQALDDASNNRTKQRLEKMVSGMYLGELTRLVLKDMISKKLLFEGKSSPAFDNKESQHAPLHGFKTAYMARVAADRSSNLRSIQKLLEKIGIKNSTIEDRRKIKAVVDLISTRSARLSAAVMAGMIYQVDPKLRKEHVIAVDGSLYEKFPGYRRLIRQALREIAGTKAHRIKVVLRGDGSGIGAAGIASVARSEARKLSIQSLPIKEQISVLRDVLSQIEKEIQEPGSGGMVDIGIISDEHGAIEKMDSLILKLIQLAFPGRIPDDFELDLNLPLEDQLAQFSITYEDLRGKVFLHNIGDLMDRGDHGIKVGERSMELVNNNLSDFIPGNHDLLVAMNLWAIHLPWYDNYNFYSYSDEYDQADPNMKLDKILIEQHQKNPKTRQKSWWAKKLYEFRKFHDGNQKGMWKPLEPQAEDLYNRAKTGPLNEQEEWIWGQFRGFNPVNKVAIYTGARAVGNMSIFWWEKLLADFKMQANAREKNSDGPGDTAVSLAAWKSSIELIEETIIPTLKNQLREKMNQEDGWTWRMFEAMNVQNYTSPEWYAMDWLYHKEWGDSVVNVELNRGLDPSNPVTSANYYDHPHARPILERIANFYLRNFNLYLRDIYETTMMHAWLPVDMKTAEFYFTYKGIEYRGKGQGEKHPSVWEGLSKIAEDFSNPNNQPHTELYEAISLVMSWYADNTTEAKPKNLAAAIQKFGAKKIAEINGFKRLVTGHIPFFEFEKLPKYLQTHVNGSPVMEGFLTEQTIGISDHGAGKRYGNRGGIIIKGRDGFHLWGYEDQNSVEIIKAPRLIANADPKKGTPGGDVVFEHKGIDRKEFLEKLLEDLNSRIGELEASLESSGKHIPGPHFDNSGKTTRAEARSEANGTGVTLDGSETVTVGDSKLNYVNLGLNTFFKIHDAGLKGLNDALGISDLEVRKDNANVFYTRSLEDDLDATYDQFENLHMQITSGIRNYSQNQQWDKFWPKMKNLFDELLEVVEKAGFDQQTFENLRLKWMELKNKGDQNDIPRLQFVGSIWAPNEQPSIEIADSLNKFINVIHSVVIERTFVQSSGFASGIVLGRSADVKSLEMIPAEIFHDAMENPKKTNIRAGKTRITLQRQMGIHRILVTGNLLSPELGGYAYIKYEENNVHEGNWKRNQFLMSLLKELGFRVEPFPGLSLGFQAFLTQKEGLQSIEEIVRKIQMIIRVLDINWEYFQQLENYFEGSIAKSNPELAETHRVFNIHPSPTNEFQRIVNDAMKRLIKGWILKVLKTEGNVDLEHKDLFLSFRNNNRNAREDWEDAFAVRDDNFGDAITIKGKVHKLWNPSEAYWDNQLSILQVGGQKAYNHLNQVLKDLGLEKMPPYNLDEFGQSFIDEHFNGAIVKAIEQGAIVLDRDGVYVANKKRDAREDIYAVEVVPGLDLEVHLSGAKALMDLGMRGQQKNWDIETLYPDRNDEKLQRKAKHIQGQLVILDEFRRKHNMLLSQLARTNYLSEDEEAGIRFLKELDELGGAILSKIPGVKPDMIDLIKRKITVLQLEYSKIEDLAGKTAFWNRMRDANDPFIYESPASLEKISTVNEIINAIHILVERNTIHFVADERTPILDLEYLETGRPSSVGDVIPRAVFLRAKASKAESPTTLLLTKSSFWLSYPINMHSAQFYANLVDPRLGGEFDLIFHEGGKSSGNLTRSEFYKYVLKRLGFEVTDVPTKTNYAFRAMLGQKQNVESLDELKWKVAFVMNMFAQSTNVDLFLHGIEKSSFRTQGPVSQLASKKEFMKNLFEGWYKKLLRVNGRAHLIEHNTEHPQINSDGREIVGIPVVLQYYRDSEDDDRWDPWGIADNESGQIALKEIGGVLRPLEGNPQIWIGYAPYKDSVERVWDKNAFKIYETLNNILSQLGLDRMPQFQPDEFIQRFIDEHFNDKISAAIESGQLMRAADGALKINSKHIKQKTVERFVDVWTSPKSNIDMLTIGSMIAQVKDNLQFKITGRIGRGRLFRNELNTLKGRYELLYWESEVGKLSLGIIALNGKILNQEEALRLFAENNLNAEIVPIQQHKLGAVIYDVDNEMMRPVLKPTIFGARSVGIPMLPGSAIGRISFSDQSSEGNGDIVFARELNNSNIGVLKNAQGFIGAEGNRNDHFNLRAASYGKPRVKIPGLKIQQDGAVPFVQLPQLDRAEGVYKGYPVSHYYANPNPIRLKENDLIFMDGTNGFIYSMGPDKDYLTAFSEMLEMEKLAQDDDKVKMIKSVLKRYYESNRMNVLFFILRALLITGTLDTPSIKKRLSFNKNGLLTNVIQEFLNDIQNRNADFGAKIRAFLVSLLGEMENLFNDIDAHVRANISRATRVDEIYYELKRMRQIEDLIKQLQNVLSDQIATSPRVNLDQKRDELKQIVTEALLSIRGKLVEDIMRFYKKYGDSRNQAPSFMAYRLREKIRALERIQIWNGWEKNRNDQDRGELVRAKDFLDELETLRIERLMQAPPKDNEITLRLEDLTQEDVPFVGNKAANLGWLINFINWYNSEESENLLVPGGFVVTAHAQNLFFNEGVAGAGSQYEGRNLFTIIEDILNSEKTDADKHRDILSTISSAGTPEPFEEELMPLIERVAATRDEFWAVRSSTLIEDHPKANAAGVFESLLGIKNEQQYMHALMEIWASLFGPAALQYRRDILGTSPSAIEKMGIITQQLIDSRAAGVITTANISKGDRSVVVINAGLGLGIGIVDSIQEGDTYVIDKSSNAEDSGMRQIGSKLKKVILDNSKGLTKIVETSESERKRSVLTSEEVSKLAAFARKVEEWFGYVVDIEFAISAKDGSINILQVRAVPGFKIEEDEKKTTEEWIGLQPTIRQETRARDEVIEQIQQKLAALDRLVDLQMEPVDLPKKIGAGTMNQPQYRDKQDLRRSIGGANAILLDRDADLQDFERVFQGLVGRKVPDRIKEKWDEIVSDLRDSFNLLNGKIWQDRFRSELRVPQSVIFSVQITQLVPSALVPLASLSYWLNLIGASSVAAGPVESPRITATLKIMDKQQTRIEEPRTVVIVAPHGQTQFSDADLRAMQLAKGSHVVVLNNTASSQLFNHLTRSGRAMGAQMKQQTFVGSWPSVKIIQDTVAKVGGKSAVVIFPSETSDVVLNEYAGVTVEGFVAAMPKHEEARFALSYMLGHTRTGAELIREVPSDAISVVLKSGALSPVSVVAGMESKLAGLVFDDIRQQAFAQSA